MNEDSEKLDNPQLDDKYDVHEDGRMTELRADNSVDLEEMM
jgi:hypothetical protein